MFSFISKLKYIINLFPYTKGKIEFTKIQFFIVLSSVLELISIGLIFPYLSVVTSFQDFEKNYEKTKYVYKFYEILNLEQNFFLIFLGLILVIIFSLSSLGSLFVKYKIVNFSQNYTAYISTKIFKKILNSNYDFFLKHSYSEIQRIINDEISRLVSGVILPAMVIFSKLVIILTIVTLLLFRNFILTILLISSVLMLYFSFYYFLKSKVSRYGKELSLLGAQKIKFTHEATALVKEIKIYNKSSYFISFFEKVAIKMAKIYSFVHIASIIPRNFIDILVFSFGIFFILYLFNYTDSSISNNIALIGFYSIAAFRIIPSYQEIYNSVIVIKNNEVSYELIDRLYNYGKPLEEPKQNNKENFFDNYNKITLKIDKFSYLEKNEDKIIFEKTSINIFKGKKIALIGENGSGKSTLINIIIGLLSSNDITYFIDDKNIKFSIYKEILKNVAYIPQNVVLFNDTIQRNITFSESYDQKLLNDSMDFSNASLFVNEQPQGSNTVVTERQLSLSGGQVQKIGISRSFYHQRPIIICDEPFTYLDTKSESNTLKKLLDQKDKTIIVITHNLNMLDNFDIIYKIEKNKIISIKNE